MPTFAYDSIGSLGRKAGILFWLLVSVTFVPAAGAVAGSLAKTVIAPLDRLVQDQDMDIKDNTTVYTPACETFNTVLWIRFT